MLPPLRLLLLLALFPGYNYAWEYTEKNEPEGWPGACIDGQFQSPINIVTEEMPRLVVEPLEFFNYKRLNGTISNNGHSVAIHFDEDNCDTGVTSGNLRGMFYLQEMHFHWQSEHTIDGKRFPLELHMVHYNSKFPDMKHAVQSQDHDGLAVIGILFNESENGSEVLNPLLQAVAGVSSKENTKRRLPHNFNPLAFLPTNRSLFYRYPGSLTTPPCLEVVTWTIMKYTLPISPEQLSIFKEVTTDDGSKLEHNYRRLQTLFERQVFLLTDNRATSMNIPLGAIIFCSVILMKYR